MATAQTVIKNFMSFLNNTTLQGTSALDAAVRAVSNFSSWTALKNSLVSDCAAYSGDWESFLKDMCGIILDNSDTGAISGSDAGGSTTKTAESIVPESGTLSYPSGTTFTTHGLTVTVPSLSSLSDSEKFIVGALYTWWIDSALTLIENSYGLGFNSAGVTVNAIDVQFYNGNDGAMAYVEYSPGKTCEVLHLKINMNYYENIDTSNSNGSATNLITYLDRTIAHEMAHAVMAANINYFASLPVIFKEGSAELVHGIDDKRTSNIKAISSSSSYLKSALNSTSVNGYAAGYVLLRYLAKQASEDRDPSVAVTVSNSNSNSNSSTTSITSAASSGTTVASSTSSVRSGGSSTSSSSSNKSTVAASATFSGTTLTVKGNFGKNIWLGGKDIITGKANTTYANNNTVTINAKQMTSARVLAGNSKNNVITAGSGGATLWGGSGGNDTLSGGSGRDVFWYSLGGGDDVIVNFTSGKNSASDVLCVSGGGVSSMTRSDGTLKLTMTDGGTLKVGVGDTVDTAIKYSTVLGSGGSNVKIKVGNADSDNTFTYDANVNYYYGGNKENTLKVSQGARIWLSKSNFSNITKVDASSSQGNNLLAGDSGSNTLIGGSGSSSLWGGTGTASDSLIGGSGSNTFWYGLGEGNDTIQGAKSTDTLKLYNIKLSDITSIKSISGGLKFNFSSGSLTVNGTIPKVRLKTGSTWVYNSTSSSWKRV